MAASSLQPGVLLQGAYVLEDELGDANGKVYPARRQRDGALVIVRLFPSLPPPLAAAVLEQAQLASRVRHPALASVEAFGRTEEGCFIVSEYVHGQRLDDWADEVGIPPLAQVIELVRRLCLGLQTAARSGMAHDGINPRNILVPKQAQSPRLPVRLLDLGVPAFVRARPHPQALRFMAPEQLRALADVERNPMFRCNGTMNVYSCGCLLYYLATGGPPYAGSTVEELRASQAAGKLALPLRINPQISPALNTLIVRALALDPATRFQTVGELADALSSAAGSVQAQASVSARPTPSMRPTPAPSVPSSAHTDDPPTFKTQRPPELRDGAAPTPRVVPTVAPPLSSREATITTPMPQQIAPPASAREASITTPMPQQIAPPASAREASITAPLSQPSAASRAQPPAPPTPHSPTPPRTTARHSAPPPPGPPAATPPPATSLPAAEHSAPIGLFSSAPPIQERRSSAPPPPGERIAPLALFSEPPPPPPPPPIRAPATIIVAEAEPVESRLVGPYHVRSRDRVRYRSSRGLGRLWWPLAAVACAASYFVIRMLSAAPPPSAANLPAANSGEPTPPPTPVAVATPVTPSQPTLPPPGPADRPPQQPSSDAAARTGAAFPSPQVVTPDRPRDSRDHTHLRPSPGPSPSPSPNTAQRAATPHPTSLPPPLPVTPAPAPAPPPTPEPAHPEAIVEAPVVEPPPVVPEPDPVHDAAPPHGRPVVTLTPEKSASVDPTAAKQSRTGKVAESSTSSTPGPAQPLVAKVEIEGIIVRGSLPTSLVRRALERIKPQLNACYARAAQAAGRNGFGDIEVDVQIDERGRARSPRAQGGKLPQLDACVADASAKLVSEKAPDTGTVSASWKVAFRP